MKKILCVLGLVLILNLLTVAVVTAAEETFTFDEVVVTASKYEEDLSETAASIEVVDQEEIQQKNAQNAADLLRDIASVQINDHGGLAGTKSVSIRGSKAEHVVILLDGQKINSVASFTTDFSQIPAQQIEKVEVLRGAAAATYGANALGGVINIITKDGSNKNQTIINLGYGSDETKQYNLTTRGSKEKLSYNLSLTTKESAGYRKNSALEQKNIFAKFTLDLDQYSNVTLLLQQNLSDKELPGSIINPSTTDQQEDKSTNLNVQWNRKTEASDTKVALYDNQHDMKSVTAYGKSEYYGQRKGIEFNKTDYYQAHTLSYGLQFEEERLKIDSSLKNDISNNFNRIVFVQDNWEIANPLNLIIGARYDDYELYSSNFSPRLGTVYTVNSKVNFHASIEESYAAPSLINLAYNESLEPESVIAYEAGMKFREQNINCALNYFKKDIDDLISWDNENERTYNIATTEVSGVELILAKKITENLATDFNYTYLDAVNAKTGEKLDYKPHHKVNLNLNYSTEELTVALNNQFVGERAGKRYPPFPASPEDTTMGSYFVSDLKVTKNIKQDLKVTLEVNNLFDKEYEVVEDYPMPGRNYMLNTEIKF